MTLDFETSTYLILDGNWYKHQDGILIKKSHKDTIAKWLKKDPNLSIKEIRKMIKDNTKVHL